jgi:prepilin-type N-terminal cleavage/methylation domain-containing protein
MKSFSSTTRSSAAQQGHTLVELLVAISLGSVVLAFLGGVLLVSEMRVSARIQRNLDDKDAANRAIDLIRREANFSSRIDSGDSSSDSIDNCHSTPLTFYQNDQTKPICYKTVALDRLPKYTGALQGPCVLIRIGYYYRPTGNIDPSRKSTSVLLDGVKKTSSNFDCSSEENRGFTSELISPHGRSSLVASPNRYANVRIEMDSKAIYNFSVRVPSNLAYDGMDLFRNCNEETGICDSNLTQVHYLPENTTKSQAFIQGDESKENLFYFRFPYDQYQVTRSPSAGTCSYANCTVTGRINTAQLENVDALIFPDKEIRPTR